MSTRLNINIGDKLTYSINIFVYFVAVKGLFHLYGATILGEYGDIAPCNAASPDSVPI